MNHYFESTLMLDDKQIEQVSDAVEGYEYKIPSVSDKDVLLKRNNLLKSYYDSLPDLFYRLMKLFPEFSLDEDRLCLLLGATESEVEKAMELLNKF